MKRGLIMEGGAMRGMFTAGVIDIMMEHLPQQTLARGKGKMDHEVCRQKRQTGAVGNDA